MDDASRVAGVVDAIGVVISAWLGSRNGALATLDHDDLELAMETVFAMIEEAHDGVPSAKLP